MVIIPIIEEYIQTKKQMIVKGSEEKSIDISILSNVEQLENVILSLANLMERIWVKNLKSVNITKHSKSWWDVNCNRDLEKYKSTKSIEDWK